MISEFLEENFLSYIEPIFTSANKDDSLYVKIISYFDLSWVRYDLPHIYIDLCFIILVIISMHLTRYLTIYHKPYLLHYKPSGNVNTEELVVISFTFFGFFSYFIAIFFTENSLSILRCIGYLASAIYLFYLKYLFFKVKGYPRETNEDLGNTYNYNKRIFLVSLSPLYLIYKFIQTESIVHGESAYLFFWMTFLGTYLIYLCYQILEIIKDIKLYGYVNR